MKANLLSSLVPLDNKSMKELVTEVKETVAADAHLTKKSSIKVIDLWKIEKKRKSASSLFANKRNHIPFI